MPEQLRACFWDYDPEQLSWERSRHTIVLRLIERGGMAAVRWLRGHMSDDEVRDFLVRRRGRGIDPRRLRFWSLLVGIPRGEVDGWIEALDAIRGTTARRSHGLGLPPAVIALLLALLVTQGCTPSENALDERALPVGTPVAIEDSASLCVGVVTGDPAQEFDRVLTPFLLPDGRLAVPLAGPREIRLFDAEGRHLATLGGEGEGPGMFSSLNAAWARGDTLEAFDDRLLRITRFLPGGAVEVVSLERIPSAQAAVPGSPSFGWVLRGVADAGMGRRDQVALHRFGRDGAHLGELARLEGMARYQVANLSGPDPLSPKTVAAVGGDRVYGGETLTPSILVFGPDGSLERDVTWSPDATASAESAYASVVETAVARASPERAEQTRRRLEAFPRTDRVSVFWGAIVDQNDFLWIRPFDPLQHALELGGYGSPGVGGDWLLFSPSGVALASVAVPSRLEPVSITRDAVVGILRDELGVESVCVHRLERG